MYAIKESHVIHVTCVRLPLLVSWLVSVPLLVATPDFGFDTLDLQVNSWPFVTPPFNLLTSSQEKLLLDVWIFNPPRTSTKLGNSTFSKLPVISTVPSTCCNLGTCTWDNSVLLAKESAPPNICSWGMDRLLNCLLLDTVRVPAICDMLGSKRDANVLLINDRSPVTWCTWFKPTSFAKLRKSPW